MRVEGNNKQKRQQNKKPFLQNLKTKRYTVGMPDGRDELHHRGKVRVFGRELQGTVEEASLATRMHDTRQVKGEGYNDDDG